MRNKKCFFLTALSLLSLSALAGCGGRTPSESKPIIEEPESSEPAGPLEIGDTVKKWSSRDDFETTPIGVQSGKGRAEIVEDNGNEDDSSIQVEVTGTGYIGTDIPVNQYFNEDDGKNGDIISLYYFVPQGSNIDTLQLQVVGSSMNNPISGELITIDESKEDCWIRTIVSFDSLETLGAIRLQYKLKDTSTPAVFFVDDIEITLGAETVTTGYQYNDESLWETYDGYFKVGTCISGSQMRNTEYRKIAKNDFNSLTAENEGKPEQVLDQEACQALLKNGDNAGIAIKTSPFEKIYDFAEANHIGIRHHTFVWYSQTPGWLFTTDYTNNGPKASKDLMLKRMENYIKVTLETINNRWPGLVYAIDVANEAIENGGIRNNNNNWYSTVGDDFVYYAMKYAFDNKDPEQELYYNDYSFDYDTRNCSFAVNTLLKKAIEEELIDGVGIQGHIDSNANLDNIITDAKMIKEKGLKCQITELDITINGSGDSALQGQKTAYKNMIKKVLESNSKGETDINAVVVWGIRDNESWKRGQNPLLFNENYEKKPAYYGFLEALEEFNA
ncbi:MAG: endo-1,4-beta-xylanase [Bacilli bacterium]|nr:endo-1,4-beta-xylanase [Bacilli bacterium]